MLSPVAASYRSVIQYLKVLYCIGEREQLNTVWYLGVGFFAKNTRGDVDFGQVTTVFYIILGKVGSVCRRRISLPEQRPFEGNVTPSVSMPPSSTVSSADPVSSYGSRSFIYYWESTMVL